MKMHYDNDKTVEFFVVEENKNNSFLSEMTRLYFLFALLFTHHALHCQESKQVQYGSQNYTVNISKAYGGGEIQTVSIAASQNLLELIRTMVKEEKIKPSAKLGDRFYKTETKTLKMVFVTYEGFDACKNVKRSHIKMVVNEKPLGLIHKDEFDKVVKVFEGGKHQTLFAKFLYNGDFDKYVSVEVSW